MTTAYPGGWALNFREVTVGMVRGTAYGGAVLQQAKLSRVTLDDLPTPSLPVSRAGGTRCARTLDTVPLLRVLNGSTGRGETPAFAIGHLVQKP